MKNQFDSEWQDATKGRFGFESRGGSYQRWIFRSLFMNCSITLFVSESGNRRRWRRCQRRRAGQVAGRQFQLATAEDRQSTEKWASSERMGKKATAILEESLANNKLKFIL